MALGLGVTPKAFTNRPKERRGVFGPTLEHTPIMVLKLERIMALQLSPPLEPRPRGEGR